jgi:hypothetical protein
MSESAGAKMGLEIRDGKIAKVGSTKRKAT